MQTTASDISVLIIGTLAVLHLHNLFYEHLLINATKVRPESAGETTLLRGHLSRPRIDISCRVHVVESIAVSVGGAHVEGTLFSACREGNGKSGRAWKLNRPTSSRTFSGCTNTEAVFPCTGKCIQHR